MSEIGTVFPPRDKWDVAAYETDELVAGYREYRPSDPEPGANRRSPAYRWGWVNRRKDSTCIPDGFEGIRSEYILMSRHAS
jgi:hypothetical protein